MTAVKNTQQTQASSDLSQDLKNEKNKIEKNKNEELKSIDFVRKNTLPGIYSTNFNGKEIIIQDRQHYCTTDPLEIKFLKEDPEIAIFNPGTKNKKQA